MIKFHSPLHTLGLWDRLGWQVQLALLRRCTWDSLAVFKVEDKRNFSYLEFSV